MYAQAVALTQKVVAFAIHHFALCLARLLGKLGFLALDPAQLVDHRQPHGFIVHHQRRRHPYPAMGRIDTQVQIFDVFAHHFHLDATDCDMARLSNHSGAWPIPECAWSQYRRCKALIPPLLEKWQPILGVQVADWGFKKMKTKWGSCNPTGRRIWFNLELAKKPVLCLEYIVVHELVHLLER